MKTTLKSRLAALSFAILAAFTFSGCGSAGGESSGNHSGFSGGGIHGGNVGH